MNDLLWCETHRAVLLLSDHQNASVTCSAVRLVESRDTSGRLLGFTVERKENADGVPVHPS